MLSGCKSMSRPASILSASNLESLGRGRRRGPLPSKGQGRKSRPNEIAARSTRTTEPTRQAGRFNLTLVTDNQRANVLADTDDFVAAHVFVGLPIQVIGRIVDQGIGEPRTPQWLKKRQAIQLIIFIIDDDKPLDIRMVMKPSEDGLASWFARQIRGAGDEWDAIGPGAVQARRIVPPIGRQHDFCACEFE